jgi:hypothetical protein
MTGARFVGGFITRGRLAGINWSVTAVARMAWSSP